MQALPAWSAEALHTIAVTLNAHAFTEKALYHKNDEVCMPCPFCKTGHDRFVVFAEGNYWCRVCEKKGHWKTLTPEERQTIEINHTINQQTALRRLAACNDWKTYHTQVKNHITDWEEQGIGQPEIDRWWLGWDNQTFQAPSLTIPIFYKQRLVNIKHRLLNGDNDKYRNHFANLPPAFFNGDAVSTNQKIFLVEGEKKAIIMEKYGLSPAISYPGVNMTDYLLAFLHKDGHEGQELIYIPDPNTVPNIMLAARELARMNRIVRVVELFIKPDDMLRRYGSRPLVDTLRMTRKI